ncbi:MAG TPA: hypothetical protein VL947_06660, partial [Cytophagales bacterium]|nr:hypothetical protein [Cytophagales bacterium]
AIRAQAPVQDSSMIIYDQIKKKASKHKLTRLLYDAVFVDRPTTVISDKDENRTKSNKQKRIDPNSRYAGRIIGKIEIIVYDPFGNNVNDTNTRKINKVQKLGNRFHLRTRKWVIKNLLLFREEERVDVLEISESERILREARYVADARIRISGTKDPDDSVTVKVYVHDRWSWEAAGGVNWPTGGSGILKDQNFGGLGLLFEQHLSYDFKSLKYEYISRYSVRSISNTYIASTIYYTSNDLKSEGGISLDRPFYSSLAKWAGGASSIKTWTYVPYIRPDSTPAKHRFEYLNTDLWIARSFHPVRRHFTLDEKSRNIGVALRVANTMYQYRPGFEVDTARLNLNSTLFMGSVGYSVRKYYKDQYIYRFGANEDIPEGSLVQIIYGLRMRELNLPKYYLGCELSRGQHFTRLGYVSGTISYGSFFNTTEKRESAMNLGLFYFSDALHLRKWKVRQFLTYRAVLGFEKRPHEYINIRADEMSGFSTDTLRGTRKMVLSLETVLYAPYRIIGFTFAPIAIMSFGVLGNGSSTYFDTPIYQSYTTGLLIRNENLVSSSFQVTVGAYPVRVGDSGQLFKFNPVTSFTLRFYGFAISKPSPVVFE